MLFKQINNMICFYLLKLCFESSNNHLKEGDSTILKFQKIQIMLL